MSVIWSGVTEEGAVVPVQVTAEGKVVAVGDGPQGDYLPITGGNLTGDLTVNNQITLATDGTATFGGLVDAVYSRLDFPGGGDPNSWGFQLNNDNGEVAKINTDGSAAFGGDIGIGGLSSAPNITLKSNGSASFADDVTVGSDAASVPDANGINLAGGSGEISARRFGTSDNYLFSGYNTVSSSRVASIASDGSASFAGGACGFTSTGEVYFTSRGTRYKLFVSQGLVQAEEYTRQMQLKERVEQFIEDKRETKPSDQGEVTTDNDNA